MRTLSQIAGKFQSSVFVKRHRCAVVKSVHDHLTLSYAQLLKSEQLLICISFHSHFTYHKIPVTSTFWLCHMLTVEGLFKDTSYAVGKKTAKSAAFRYFGP